MMIFSCQFVVRESGDYLLQATDPDALVDWDVIEQVVSMCNISAKFYNVKWRVPNSLFINHLLCR